MTRRASHPLPPSQDRRYQTSSARARGMLTLKPSEGWVMNTKDQPHLLFKHLFAASEVPTSGDQWILLSPQLQAYFPKFRYIIAVRLYGLLQGIDHSGPLWPRLELFYLSFGLTKSCFIQYLSGCGANKSMILDFHLHLQLTIFTIIIIYRWRDYVVLCVHTSAFQSMTL